MDFGSFERLSEAREHLRAHFDTFAQERIGPAMASAGIEGGPPEVHEFPVHEHFPR